MSGLNFKNKFKTWWQNLRTFDYSNLNFLQITSLLTIACIFTLFRAIQLHENHKEARALNAVQLLDAQQDLASDLERLIVLTLGQDHVADPSQTTGTELFSTYSRFVQNRSELLQFHEDLQAVCAGHPCMTIFKTPYYPFTPGQLEKALFNPPSAASSQKILHQTLQATAVLEAALKDAIDRMFKEVRSGHQTTLVFDVIGYFMLLMFLFLQTLYVFRPAVRRLNDSLSIRSDFLSRISHEIRNPMNSIIGMADILNGTRLNFEQQQYVGNLLRSGNALLDMLNNLIDFSVIETGHLQLQREPMDLFHCLDHCLSLISTQAHHKNLNVYLIVDPRVPPRLIGDGPRLNQVLINLLNNAVKFTDQGFIKLAVELCNDDSALSQTALKFTIEDSGIGIKDEQLDEIFESFVQADSSIQRKYGGSGLGLSISREILRLMGAKLKVESKHGKGSSFFFTLHLKEQKTKEESATAAATPLVKLAQRRLVFLVAENEFTHYREVLGHLTCHLDLLNSALELRTLLKTSESDVSEILIADSLGIISMINCRNVADEFGLGDRSAALIRTNFTKESMDLLKRNGFDRFLTKPLRPWELITLPPKVPHELPRQIGQHSQVSLLGKLKERNLKMLLVDDSNDNLFLLKEVVGPVASTVHFAENGLEAIEKFRVNEYDVVFMDIQMPVMDGYTAIRKMRQVEIEMRKGQSIPIYAVTAHAGLVDAQKCREAGFTDRVVKPVVRNDIYTSLSRAFALDTAEIGITEDSLIPAKYLFKLIPTFLKTRFEDLEKLKTAISSRDFISIQSLGHKIKGSSASYGFMVLGELSLKLERAASAQNLSLCADIVEQLGKSVQEENERFKEKC